jgi:hypothetical protein
MNAILRTKILIVAVITAFFSSTAFSMNAKEARAQIEAIIEAGTWGVVAVSADEKQTMRIDYGTLTHSGGSVEFWVTHTDQPLSKYTINCSRQDYRLVHFQVGSIAWGTSSGLKLINNNVPIVEGTMASVIQKKLCGRLVPALGVIVKYLFSTDTATWYWVPSFSYRGAESVTVPVHLELPAGAAPGEISADSNFYNWEFHCSQNRSRSGPLSSWGRVPDIGETEEWQGFEEGSGLSTVRSKLCSDPTIVLRQADPVPTDNSNVDKTLAAVENAKEKCLKLGFKVGTERFGECVLTLSK